MGYGQLSGAGLLAYNQMEQRLVQNLYPRLSAARMNPLIRKDSMVRESELSRLDEESQFERMLTERVQSQIPFSDNYYAFDPRDDRAQLPFTMAPLTGRTQKNNVDLEMQKDTASFELFGQKKQETQGFTEQPRKTTFADAATQSFADFKDAQCSPEELREKQSTSCQIQTDSMSSKDQEEEDIVCFKCQGSM